MAEIRFYHLYARSLEQALPALLEKAWRAGYRAVVQLGSPERVEHLTDHLWTYRQDSFLPHGSAADGAPAWQPIYLTAEAECPNEAGLLVLADGAYTDTVSAFSLVCVLFDGRDETAVQTARSYWRHWRAAGHPLTYWQEGAGGGWQKRAETGTASQAPG